MSRVQRIALRVSLILILAFQLQLLPFFSPWLSTNKTVWAIAYYCFWLLVVCASLAGLTLPGVFRSSLPVVIFCGLLATLAVFQLPDPIAKNIIAAVTFVVCLVVLTIAAGPYLLLRFSAAITSMCAVICLASVPFQPGLANIAGRAADLSVNPNLTALGLLLGASAAYYVIPLHLAGYFIVLIFAAIFATLSKSTLLAFSVIFGVVVLHTLMTKRPRLFGPALLVLCLCAWLFAASLANHRFHVAALLAYDGLRNAVTAFETARAYVAGRVATRLDTNRAYVEELGKRIETEGDVNSISARFLLMERAWLVYRASPPFGVGLQAAHELQPHNSFLLFALAFGPVGWLVPLAFIGLTIRPRVADMPLPLAVFIAAMVSHDVFLEPGLLAPVVLGMAAARVNNGPVPAGREYAAG